VNPLWIAVAILAAWQVVLTIAWLRQRKDIAQLDALDEAALQCLERADDILVEHTKQLDELAADVNHALGRRP
jgi:hypothetical protein